MIGVLKNVLSGFLGFKLEELDELDLFYRQDRKFVFRLDHLGQLLSKLNNYSCLEINGKRFFQYENKYLDTSDFRLYHMHHNGKQNRCKVRFRNYFETGDCFLEVNENAKRNSTDKTRFRTETIEMPDDSDIISFIENKTASDIGELEHVLTTTYSRITLLDRRRREKITLDFDIHFKNTMNEHPLSDIVIAEIKSCSEESNSPFLSLLKEFGIREMNMSKYCIGMLLTHNGLKHNRFKSKLLNLEKISDDIRINN